MELSEEFVQKSRKIIQAVVARTLSRYGRFEESEVEDLIQDIFCKLLDNDHKLLRNYDSAKASLSTYLGTIAKNQTIDYLRKKRNFVPFSEQLSTEEQERELDLPKRLLSPREELILKLFFEKEMDTKEIAHFLHITPQTVRSMKHKAIQKLRSYYGVKK